MLLDELKKKKKSTTQNCGTKTPYRCDVATTAGGETIIPGRVLSADGWETAPLSFLVIRVVRRKGGTSLFGGDLAGIRGTSEQLNLVTVVTRLGKSQRCCVMG